MDTGQYHKITIIINDQSFKPFDIPKLRGFFAAKYAKFDLIHNHLMDKQKQVRYAYPVIQFKIIDGHPALVGIADGIPVLKEVFMDVDHLEIGNEYRVINEKSIKLEAVRFGQIDTPRHYRFLLPWMALKQENYHQYRQLKWNEKRPFLEKILLGNLKSISHGFGYWIENFESLYVESNLKPVSRNFKNIRMTCFEGGFSTNFMIPDYLGLGKQTARGFGTVIRIQSRDHLQNRSNKTE